MHIQYGMQLYCTVSLERKCIVPLHQNSPEISLWKTISFKIPPWAAACPQNPLAFLWECPFKIFFSQYLFYLTVPREKRVHRHRNTGYNPDLGPAESAGHLRNCFLTEMILSESAAISALKGSRCDSDHHPYTYTWHTLFHLFISELCRMKKKKRNDDDSSWWIKHFPH